MATLIKDVTLQENIPTNILFEKHIDFIKEYGQKESSFEYGMTDYLRVSGMYWGLTALELMNASPPHSIEEVRFFVVHEFYFELFIQLLSDFRVHKKVSRCRNWWNKCMC